MLKFWRNYVLFGLPVVLAGLAVAAASNPDANDVERQGKLTAADAVTVVVTTDTWRSVLEQLDDVYTNPEVSRLRRDLMTSFVRAMSAADQIKTFEERKTARRAARHEPLLGLEQLVRLRAQAQDPTTSSEAALALAEGFLNVGDFPTAMKSAKAFLEKSDSATQRAQAYRILIRAARGAGDGATVTQLRKEFVDELPSEARFNSPTELPFGPVRVAAEMYQQAQAQDDFALEHQKATELAANAIRLRDETRKSAAATLAIRDRGD